MSSRDIIPESYRDAVHINAAVASGSHFSKGDQSLKAAIDRISGSGVFGRDPDSIVTLTQHEEDEALTVEMILRNFPPQPKFVVQWEHPLMVLADHLDPNNLKSSSKSRERHDDEEIIALLGNNGLVLADWIREAEEQLGVSKSTIIRARKKFLDTGKIFKSEIDDKYCPRV
jgi:hypothetical protein